MIRVHVAAAKNTRIAVGDNLLKIHSSYSGYRNCIEGIVREDKHLEKGNLEMLLSLLGNPQNQLKFIHIAGTNGKGSVAMMLSNILTAAGYRTGLFVSPGIEAVNDRFRIDGQRIADGELVELARKVQEAAEQVGGFCEFELMMCIGFLYYVKNGCDIVVLETGIGGRNDCTNVIPEKEVAVITSIGYDHTALLGETLTAIASEKAGIISPNGAVVCGCMPQEATTEIARYAETLGATAVFVAKEDVHFAGISGEMQLLDYKEYKNIPLSLFGYQQLLNGAVVLEVCQYLAQKGWNVTEPAIMYGVSHTIWEGRMERVSNHPMTILDGAHNPESAAMLKRNMELYFSDKNIIYVIGMMKDKNKEQVLCTLLPGCKAAIAVTVPGPRGEQGEILKDMMKEYCQNSTYNVTMEGALTYAESICSEQDMICICGSLYLIQEVREYYKAGGYLD